MLSTFSSEFQGVVNSHAVRPGAAQGAALTPSQNSYGSYAAVQGTPLANDAFGILIGINNVISFGAASDTIVTIGKDDAGGTPYTDYIPHLLASGAPPVTIAPINLLYYFPLFFPAGSTIGAKASTNRVGGSCSVWVRTFHKPKRPELIRVGSYVEALGIVTASSRGTLITSGTTSDGAWTSLGSPAKPCWGWQMGFGFNDGSTGGATYYADLSVGDGTNQKMIIEDQCYSPNGNEQLISQVLPVFPFMEVAASDTVYGRLQCSGTADSNLSLGAYGVGG